jgi:hypothetical protein
MDGRTETHKLSKEKKKKKKIDAHNCRTISPGFLHQVPTARAQALSPCFVVCISNRAAQE